MKRLFLAVAVVLSASMAQARVDNKENFKVENHTYELSRYLGLEKEQSSEVFNIMNYFDDCMQDAQSVNQGRRPQKVQYAVNSHMKLMRNVLNEDQYHKYLAVLNHTMRNHDLTKYYNK